MSESKYTPELAAEICRLVAEGRTMKSVGQELGVPRATLWDWTKRHPEFRDQLTMARQAGADALADETVDIADTEPDPQRARVRVETRKWLAATINPQRYGPKMDVTVEDRVSVAAALAAARARLDSLRRDPPLPSLPAQPAPLAGDAAAADGEDILS